LKVRFKVNKRFNLLVTLFAGAAAVWMMVVRFGYPVEKVLTALWFSLAGIVVIMLITAPLALLLRWWNNRDDDDHFKPREKDPEQ